MAAGAMIRTRWPRQRIFRLGFLVGRGCRAEDARHDPIVDADPAEACEMARRYGARFGDGRAQRIVIEIERESLAKLVAEAQRRRTHSERLAATIIGRALSNPVFMED